MKLKLGILLISALLVMAFYSNSPYAFLYPNYFPKPQYDFAKNPISKKKVDLGRMLFYEPLLSKDNTISCASCHSPFNAFAHTDHDLSHGINDSIGTRNAPSLFNLAWQKTFMWDGAVNHLDMQALAPISHPGEMDESIESVVQKLQASETYRASFYKTWGDSTITGEHLLKSLSQFQLTLISANSKYDRVKQKKEKFTEQEEAGYTLFKTHCNSCHSEPLFSSYQFANNGLPIDPTLNDYGKGAITKKPSDSLLFKTPSLRNLSYTYPYMHDGRFKKLNEILNHYTNGIVPSPTLPQQLQKPINLSSNDKTDLIAFLLTLNDKEFVFNPNHQFPKEVLKAAKD